MYTSQKLSKLHVLLLSFSKFPDTTSFRYLIYRNRFSILRTNSLLANCFLLLVACYSLPYICYLLLFTHYSLLFIGYSLLPSKHINLIVHQRCFNVDIWLKMKIEPTYIYRRCFNVGKTMLKQRGQSYVDSTSMNQRCFYVEIWLKMKVEPTYIYLFRFQSLSVDVFMQLLKRK